MTMTKFSTAELGGLQAAQESAMQDTCIILEFEPGSADDYGIPDPVWNAGESYDCGLDGRARREYMGEAQVEEYDAILRLPIDAEVEQTDRIRITHRFGVELDDSVDYEIVAAPRRGPSGLLVTLKKVIDGRS